MLQTSEGRRQMSKVKGDAYGLLSRFRDGGSHFDLPDDYEEKEENDGCCGLCRLWNLLRTCVSIILNASFWMLVIIVGILLVLKWSGVV